MNLLQRLTAGEQRQTFPSMSIAQYLEQIAFSFGGNQYSVLTTMGKNGTQTIDPSFAAMASNIYHANPTAFSCMMVRLLIFSEARLLWRDWEGGRPQAPYLGEGLDLFTRPWPKGSTGSMLAQMLLDSDIAGTSYIARREYQSGPGLRRLRPDRVSVVLGTDETIASNPMPHEVDLAEVDSTVIGYLYHPGGYQAGNEPVGFEADEVAAFSPLPDSTATWRGMSWLSPLIREVTVDQAATTHRLKFFQNHATSNAVVKLDITDIEKFREWVDLFKEEHQGVANAFKNIYLGAGADYTVVGTNFKDMDLRAISGLSETRIAAASGVPAVISGLSEGLQGSALNAGNYGSARRRFADGTMRPLWRTVCAALDQIADNPKPESELWYSDRDIPFLQEDAKDDAEIRRLDSSAIRQLVDGGYTPDSVVAAVDANDLSQLVHSGLLSVQLQRPNTGGGTGDGAGTASEGEGSAADLFARILDLMPPAIDGEGLE